MGLPIYGDAVFIGDWVRAEGLSLIAGRTRKWSALMAIINQTEIPQYVVQNHLLDAGNQAVIENRLGNIL